MVVVTKREAVRTLIRGAMQSIRDKDDVCAVTLAGAAEEAMPRSDDLTGFDILKRIRMELTSSSAKVAQDALNAERNWLKHHSIGETDSMNIEGGYVMLLRAVSRYVAVYGLDEIAEDFAKFMGWLPDPKRGFGMIMPPPKS